MIQFNLLPDVKLDYIKAERQKHLVVSVSTIASIAAVTLFVILIVVVDVWQKKSMSDLNADITTDSSQLQSTQSLNKILTVQNQLGALETLHNQKPVVSRLFGYLQQITPATATIATLNVDYTQQTMTITGSAKTIDDVNTFVDTLKFATYGTSSSSTQQNAFTNVVLSSFSRSTNSATYTINLSFAPTIFSETSNVVLTVPNKITTRSVLGLPALFNTTNTGNQ
ncbi:MAG TPA: hypothetical protein VIM53_03970 [Candidatus Saccharimonadales bacterium]